MTLPYFNLSEPTGRQGFQRRLDRLRGTASSSSAAAGAVAAIIEEVRRHGDDAVVRYMRQWTDPDFTADRIVVSPDELDVALQRLDPRLREAIETSIQHVRQYQEHILPRDPAPVTIGGAELGMRFTPVESVGCCVPGGSAVLFSTLIMLAVPALVAGVPAEQISVINPPPTRQPGAPVGDISPIVLATCRLLGVQRVYRIGGAQAVAALALGTQSVRSVHLLAGPGNVYVQLAKQQLAGVVGTDGGFYGPSEILTIADETARVDRIAADLIAQAEHDPGKCFLASWSEPVLQAIEQEVARQLAQRGRQKAIERALDEESAALLVRDEDEAVWLADQIAAEHVNLAVRDPDALLRRLRHGGEFFLGDATPVAAGDYYAGPSHCLPTGSTARFASGISVYTFLKRSGTVCYRQGMPAQAIDHVARLAEAEGLDAHAWSARVRGS